MVPGSSMGPDVSMASDASVGHSDQCVPVQQHRPQASAWFQVAAQTVDICLAFGGILGHGHQHGPNFQLDHGPRHGPKWQPGPGCHHGLRR